jgi:hypothetical protein
MVVAGAAVGCPAVIPGVIDRCGHRTSLGGQGGEQQKGEEKETAHGVIGVDVRKYAPWGRLCQVQTCFSNVLLAALSYDCPARYTCCYWVVGVNSQPLVKLKERVAPTGLLSTMHSSLVRFQRNYMMASDEGLLRPISACVPPGCNHNFSIGTQII